MTTAVEPSWCCIAENASGAAPGPLSISLGADDTGFFAVKNAKGTLLFGGAVVASFGTTKAKLIKP